MAGALGPMSAAAYGSPNRMQVLANGDIVDCARLPQTARNNLYKTELCKHFSEHGACRYGAKCQFAHGIDELRGVLRHPKYKTTRCKAFIQTGKCMYGARCRFIHRGVAADDEEDARDALSSTASESDEQDLPLKDLLVNPYGDALEPIDLSTPFGGVKTVTLLPLTSSAAAAGLAAPAHADAFRAPFGGFGYSGLAADAPAFSPAAFPARAERSNSAGSSSRLSIFQRICREDE